MGDFALSRPAGGGKGHQGQLTTINYAEIILRDPQSHKQLALSHVDLHVLGCMLKLGEYVPASPDYRRILTRARQTQKNEVLYLHKLLTIGSSDNYLCDQLLKFRAGENVLALLSASVPVMSEEACVAMLSELFECTGALPENIPGRVQLENFRAALVALARRSGFGEKAALYHGLLTRVLEGTEHLPTSDPYNSLADPVQMARYIKLLHRVVTSEEPFIVMWKGLRGAAWAAAYATHILGLNACALDWKMTPVPITSSYEDAKVIIDLASNQNVCELYLQGELQDVVKPSSEVAFRKQGWSIDCRILNLVDLNHPGIKQKSDFGRASTFAAIELYNELWRATSYFEQWTADALWYRSYAGAHSKGDDEEQPTRKLGFRTYTKSVMSELFGRALIVLHDLGFRPAMTGYSFNSDGSACEGHESDPQISYDEIVIDGEEYDIDGPFGTRKILGASKVIRNQNLSGRYLGPGWDRSYLSRLDNYLKSAKTSSRVDHVAQQRSGNVYGNVNIDGNAKVQLGDVHHHHHEDKQIVDLPIPNRLALGETIQLAVRLASRLAFTDWHHTVQMISMNVLSEDFDHTTPDQRQFEGLISETISFCFDGIETRALEMRLWSDDWLALDLDGFVVTRAVALKPDIASIRGKLVSFASGSIQFEGSRYKKVRNDRSTLSLDRNYSDRGSRANIYLQRGSLEGQPDKVVSFKNKFPNPHLRPLVSASGDTVFLRTEVYLDSGQPIFIDGTRSSRNLQNLLISDPCIHGYQSSCHISKVFEHDQILGRIFEGLFFDDFREHALVINPTLSSCPVYIQHTKDNPKLQWLALQWLPQSDPDRCLVVLQRNCCIPCLLDRICVIIESIRQSNAEAMANGYPICIIAGNDPSHRVAADKRQRQRDDGATSKLNGPTTLPIRHGQNASQSASPARQPPSPSSSFSSVSTVPNMHDTEDKRSKCGGTVRRKPVPSPEPPTLKLPV